ncbi:carbonic anhydrase [Rhodoblastus sp.]|uniref:carbonic anhydrase n=1 Tax=Rhodoblastus sp. TaxID=1962975 RepID=UPI00262F5D0C|nr:carbonic anhydrase [Rhodoblastus sp.]
MCVICAVQSRRAFLTKAASVAGAAAFAGAGLRPAYAASAEPSGGPSPEEAFAKLKAGNQKYLAAPQLCEADLAASRASVAKGQAPWATVLACSDSRVSPELIFGGVGPGELFVARNAGNVADTAVVGSIEYAIEHLHCPLVVVMGHGRCGAVAAACDVVRNDARLPGSIGPMVAAIAPAARAVMNEPGDFVENAMRQNVRNQAAIVRKSAIFAGLAKAGKVKLVAARYDLDTGAVEFLD